MKLIIEVTEDYYEWLKEKINNYKANVSDITILDGKPYEERPQGHWKEFYDCINCSECDYTWRHFKTDFCPTCGADMRGSKA